MLAYASCSATSSTSTARTWSAPAVTTDGLSAVPKPPTMMLRIERFIAFAISLVRMLPDAPTSAPAMIRTLLSMTNPAIATAVPVKALSSEMTTGMSAPPIGITIVTPKVRPSTRMITRAATERWSPQIRYAPPPSAPRASAAFSRRTAGNVTGALLTTPCSLPAAINEPVKVTAPMMTSSTVATVARVDSSSEWCETTRTNSVIATSAAAPPPAALNRLTSCGMSVMWTVRAPTRPATPPTMMPTMTTAQPIPVIVPWWAT